MLERTFHCDQPNFDYCWVLEELSAELLGGLVVGFLMDVKKIIVKKL